MKHRSAFPKFVNFFRGRHGQLRTFFRRGAFRVELPEPALGPAWWETYHATLADFLGGREPGARSKIGANRVLSGTVAAAFVVYTGSANFRVQLSESTQKAHFRMLRAWVDLWGEHRIGHLRRADVARFVAEKSATPAAAREFLKALRRMMVYLVEIGEIEEDPTERVKPPKLAANEIHTWSEAQIEHYRAHHPIGSTARLALELMLNTGQRLSDAIRMGRQHVRDGAIHIVQQKTGAPVDVPIEPDLAEAFAGAPQGNLTFLVNQYGAPFSAKGFGEAFRGWCRAAGLPGECTAHGLRKACARRLAEAGCNASGIMSVTGHKTLAEVERYTRAVDRERLAREAMTKLRMRN
jgi:integrase